MNKKILPSISNLSFKSKKLPFALPSESPIPLMMIYPLAKQWEVWRFPILTLDLMASGSTVLKILGAKGLEPTSTTYTLPLFNAGITKLFLFFEGSLKQLEQEFQPVWCTSS